MANKSALLIGASGLVGSKLLQYLLDSKEYNKVTIFLRKSIGFTHDKLEERVINFEQLEEYQELFRVDDVFCTLGTTMKKAKSKENFTKVDFVYPLEMAKLAEKYQANFYIVTSIGADPKSPFFYSRVKGQLEKELIKLNLPALHIFQPSLLLGDRKEFRLGEEIGAVFSKIFSIFFIGPFKKYNAISAEKVAYAMYRATQQKLNGAHIYLSDEIAKMGDNT